MISIEPETLMFLWTADSELYCDVKGMHYSYYSKLSFADASF